MKSVPFFFQEDQVEADGRSLLYSDILESSGQTDGSVVTWGTNAYFVMNEYENCGQGAGG